MVLMGLHFDQNQGFLLQNPIMLVGLFSIGLLPLTANPFSPPGSSFIPVIYGSQCPAPKLVRGYCFSGRFGWSAAVVFLLPTVFGLVRLANVRARAFWMIIGCSLLLQVSFAGLYMFGSFDFYNKPSYTSPYYYSIFYFPIHHWMPALYNADWAYRYAPNYGWLTFILLVLVLGFLASGDSNKIPSKMRSNILKPLR